MGEVPKNLRIWHQEKQTGKLSLLLLLQARIPFLTVPKSTAKTS